MIAINDVLRSRGFDEERIARHLERYGRAVGTMIPWFPERVKCFLDIGSGTGGIAALMARRYLNADVLLIDGGSERVSWTSYRSDGEPWADVHGAVNMVDLAAGNPERRIIGYCPPVESLAGCELIYSICSWGHHYPIETYLDLVRRTLVPGGRLIVDLRKGDVGEHGRTVLARHFEFVARASEGKKYDRTVWSG